MVLFVQVATDRKDTISEDLFVACSPGGVRSQVSIQPVQEDLHALLHLLLQ